MAGSIPWKKLEYQYLNYCNQDREDFDELIQSPENYVSVSENYVFPIIDLNDIYSSIFYQDEN